MHYILIIVFIASISMHSIYPLYLKHTLYIVFIPFLSVLEIVNLLTVGLTSYNLKQHIPDDGPDNLQSEDWLTKINEWTLNQKMMINEQKTKNMIFNFKPKYPFATRLVLKLLGTIISDDLRWDLNTANIVKKAKAHLQLLRTVASFSPPIVDLKTIKFLFIIINNQQLFGIPA
jgi:hypothetical protein